MSGYFLTFLLGIMPLSAWHFNITNIAQPQKTITLQGSGGKISEKYPFGLHLSQGLLQEISETQPYRLRRVCLDAGHGGHDPGCVHGKLREKDQTLTMTLKLGALISENFPNIEVIYTRETDEFIDLRERAAIANRAKADLFISIHCNSTNTASGAFGTETYTVGTHKMTSSFEVSKRENAAMLLEKDYEEKYDGFDPSSDEAYILFSYIHNVHIEKSKKFAQFVEDEMVTTAKRKSLGVKQAGFWVLHATAMPSVLIETGFLNHPIESKFISSEAGQTKIVAAIFEAFKRYKEAVEYAKNVPNETLKSYPSTLSNTPNLVAKSSQMASEMPKTVVNKLDKKAISKNEDEVTPIRSVEKAMEKPIAKTNNIPKAILAKNMIQLAKVPIKKSQTPAKTTENKTPNHGKIEENIVYKVLVIKSKVAIKEKDRKIGKWNGLKVEVYREKGEYWYLVGNTPQHQNAKALCTRLKHKGFEEAKVLKLKQGKVIQ